MTPEEKLHMVIDPLAAELDDKIFQVSGERMGFILVTVPFNREGASNCVTNLFPEDRVRIMAKLLEYWTEELPINGKELM